MELNRLKILTIFTIGLNGKSEVSLLIWSTGCFPIHGCLPADLWLWRFAHPKLKQVKRSMLLESQFGQVFLKMELTIRWASADSWALEWSHLSMMLWSSSTTSRLLKSGKLRVLTPITLFLSSITTLLLWLFGWLRRQPTLLTGLPSITSWTPNTLGRALTYSLPIRIRSSIRILTTRIRLLILRSRTLKSEKQASITTRLVFLLILLQACSVSVQTTIFAEQVILLANSLSNSNMMKLRWLATTTSASITPTHLMKRRLQMPLRLSS